MRRSLLSRLLLSTAVLVAVTDGIAYGGSNGEAADTLGDVTIDVDTTWAEGAYEVDTLTVTDGATLSVAGGSILDVSGAVTLTDGSTLAAHTTVCTIGTRSNPLVEGLGLATHRGRIVTEADGSIASHDGLWALGDCAATPNAADGAISPPTAQFAIAQASQLAHNLVARIEGTPTRAFSHRSRGMMATTGHQKGVAQAFGVPLTGLPAWLLWRAYYLMQMPTLGRKVRIWVEWTWSVFFPADITHLRFTRTEEVDMDSGLVLTAPKN